MAIPEKRLNELAKIILQEEMMQKYVERKGNEPEKTEHDQKIAEAARLNNISEKELREALRILFAEAVSIHASRGGKLF